MNILLYDLEIKRAIQAKGEALVAGYEYCEGWNDHANMGISTLCAYDYATQKYSVFCDDNREEFVDAVAKADQLVTFNGLSFDNKVIQACWDIPAVALETRAYDLFAVIKKMTGTWCSLDAMCEQNLGVKKSSSGAFAPFMWQDGRIGKVIDYCLNDVFMTKMLFDIVMKGGIIVNPKNGIEMVLPWTSPPKKG